MNKWLNATSSKTKRERKSMRKWMCLCCSSLNLKARQRMSIRFSNVYKIIQVSEQNKRKHWNKQQIGFVCSRLANREWFIWRRHSTPMHLHSFFFQPETQKCLSSHLISMQRNLTVISYFRQMLTRFNNGGERKISKLTKLRWKRERANERTNEIQKAKERKKETVQSAII